MKLNEINKNERFTIISIPDGEVGAQAIRLGIFKNAKAECILRIENGPVLLNINGQEVAVGNSLADKIEISI